MADARAHAHRIKKSKAFKNMKAKTEKINRLIKNDGFDQNGGRHELRHEKMMHFDPGDVDFRATATRFVNIQCACARASATVLKQQSIRYHIPGIKQNKSIRLLG